MISYDNFAAAIFFFIELINKLITLSGTPMAIKLIQ